MVVSSLIFKIVDSQNGVVKATGKYWRPVLNAESNDNLTLVDSRIH